ncbi:deleted in azoospermia-like [Polyodon spathula]|uniref:deleted in azoospermia-like n=1 Tax=Polyodon spathula TaxID=7913 RepID=UPI001B7DC5B5|nr:deleted in azoospermia-like [Polyodon spathula]
MSHQVVCESDECRQNQAFAIRSGLRTFCTSATITEILKDVLAKMFRRKWFGENRKQECLKRQKEAHTLNIPPIAVNLGLFHRVGEVGSSSDCSRVPGCKKTLIGSWDRRMTTEPRVPELCEESPLSSSVRQLQRHNVGEKGPQISPSTKMANGYILPEGKVTPNTIFVGGIDMKVDEREIRDFFARYGSVKEVKIITYRGGICKGYGFVSFEEDVDIQTIVDQQISFKGRKLKLGPAIMKERMPCSSQSLGPEQWMQAPSQQVYCVCNNQMMENVMQPFPVMSPGNQYVQPYTYPGFPAVVMPEMPMGYSQNAYAYQYAAPQWPAGDHRTRLVNQSFVDCGVQTVLTLL